jgi:large subunit ribosomal protein L30
MANRLKIRQIRSSSKRRFDQALTLKALGIRRLQDTVEHNDTPQIRGMIKKIGHLLEVEEQPGPAASKAARKPGGKS